MRTAVLSDKLHLAMTEHKLLAYFCRYTAITVLSAVGNSAATSGPKHRHCNVHNGLTRITCGPTATSQFACTLAPVGNSSSAPARSRECIATR